MERYPTIHPAIIEEERRRRDREYEDRRLPLYLPIPELPPRPEKEDREVTYEIEF